MVVYAQNDARKTTFLESIEAKPMSSSMLLERRLVIPVKVNKLSGSVRRLSMTSPGRKF
jgi:hypothetical protein